MFPSNWGTATNWVRVLGELLLLTIMTSKWSLLKNIIITVQKTSSLNGPENCYILWPNVWILVAVKLDVQRVKAPSMNWMLTNGKTMTMCKYSWPVSAAGCQLPTQRPLHFPTRGRHITHHGSGAHRGGVHVRLRGPLELLTFAPISFWVESKI